MTELDYESTRRAFVTMLRRCADYLSELPPGEVDALLNGELELRLSVVAKKQKPNKKSTNKLDPAQMSDIETRLRSMDNRLDGERLLRDVAPTKAEMESFARHLDIAVRREDRTEDLMRRIIEGTIGYRLSSAAIQGRAADRKQQESTVSYSPKTKK